MTGAPAARSTGTRSTPRSNPHPNPDPNPGPHPNPNPNLNPNPKQVDAQISAHDLHESYLPAFRQSVTEGGALGVMCSYNAVNGVPSCARHWPFYSLWP